MPTLEPDQIVGGRFQIQQWPFDLTPWVQRYFAAGPGNLPCILNQFLAEGSESTLQNLTEEVDGFQSSSPVMLHCFPPFEHDGDLYLAERLGAGQLLSEHLRETDAPTLEESLEVFEKVLRLLMRVHGQKHSGRPMIHGDLGTDQIVRFPDGTLKLTIPSLLEDVVRRSRPDADDTIPTYWAPERATFAQRIQTDLYGAGLCFLEIALDRPRWEFIGRDEGKAPMVDLYMWRGRLPDDLVRVLGSLVDSKPENRPRDAAAALSLIHGSLGRCGGCGAWVLTGLPFCAKCAPGQVRSRAHEQISQRAGADSRLSEAAERSIVADLVAAGFDHEASTVAVREIAATDGVVREADLPILSIEPTAIEWPADAPRATFRVKNRGGGVLKYEVDCSALELTVEPMSGTLLKDEWHEHRIGFAASRPSLGLRDSIEVRTESDRTVIPVRVAPPAEAPAKKPRTAPLPSPTLPTPPPLPPEKPPVTPKRFARGPLSIDPPLPPEKPPLTPASQRAEETAKPAADPTPKTHSPASASDYLVTLVVLAIPVFLIVWAIQGVRGCVQAQEQRATTTTENPPTDGTPLGGTTPPPRKPPPGTEPPPPAPQLGKVSIQTSPSNAEVVMNDAVVGRTPFDTTVGPGQRFQVRLPGYSARTLTVGRTALEQGVLQADLALDSMFDLGGEWHGHFGKTLDKQLSMRLATPSPAWEISGDAVVGEKSGKILGTMNPLTLEINFESAELALIFNGTIIRAGAMKGTAKNMGAPLSYPWEVTKP